MGSHHQVCVDENTQITHRLIWVDRGPVDEQWRRGQLVSPYLMLYDFILSQKAMADYCWVYGVIHFTSPAG